MSCHSSAKPSHLTYVTHTLYQCFFTLPSVRVGNDYFAVLVLPLCKPTCGPDSVTFAISAQLFPASRMFFSRSSSAGVHGVLVRLFLGGGSIGDEARTGSPMPGADDAGATGADMARGGAPGARLLFRAAVCWGDASGRTAGLSPAPGCAKNWGTPDGNSSSCLSPRLDMDI
jgi:hypothetical protein